MKRYSLMLGLLLAGVAANAQDTYSNATLTSTADVIGTSRYVGMGGAMGALGADISVISSNPAGIALMKKTDISFTAGANWPKNRKYGDYYNDKVARPTFDQAGFVWNLNTDGKLRNVNFGFNYQKKANYNSAFLADNPNLNGLSQMDQVAELATAQEKIFDTGVNGSAITSNAYNAFLIDPTFNADGSLSHFNNTLKSAYNNYSHYSTGSLQSYDFNVSFNLKDRAYFGFTLGVDNVDYNRYTEYSEYKENDKCNYLVDEDQRVDGTGINAKFGAIVRPIEDNSFRIGFAIETPTWYSLKSSTLMSTCANNDSIIAYYNGRYDAEESFLEYNVTTPWKVRLSLGQTVGTKFAWGLEYEYQNQAKVKQSYSDDGGYYDGRGYRNSHRVKDADMNEITKNNMRSQHTVKVGFEYKPISCLSLRAGYNFISSPYKDGAHFDQYGVDSYALNYTTGTSYMNLSSTNILTLGIGYKHKAFYVDLAYKFRHQTGDFYAFDTSFTSSGTQFTENNPELLGVGISPVDVNLSRHNLTCTLGFKF